MSQFTLDEWQLLTKHLEQDEGRRLEIYADSLGKLTVGVGFLVDELTINELYEGARNKGAKFLNYTMTDEMVSKLFNNKVNEAVESASRFACWSRLNSFRRMALVNMVYNLGATGVSRFKKMLTALSYGNFRKAAIECLDSRYYKQHIDALRDTHTLTSLVTLRPERVALMLCLGNMYDPEDEYHLRTIYSLRVEVAERNGNDYFPRR